MGDFTTFLQLGYQHISDLGAYDHILFLIGLTAIYRPGQWRAVLILVTAFTVGHSITLALAALNILPVNTAVIEFLIPVTILATAFNNVLRRPDTHRQVLYINYGLALVFGLIHGMGFSNYLRSLLGSQESIVTPLLGFNIGLELGQLLIVAVIFAILSVAHLLGTPHRSWNLFVSGAVAGVAFILATETYPW